MKIINIWKVYSFLTWKGFFKSVDDRKHLKRMYRAAFNKKIDIDNPISFNEKLQWLKLNDRKKIYTTMVDKYSVKEYVSKIIGEKYIIPTLQVHDSFDEIDFDKLPEQFVIKCTHDSGGLVIVKNKNELDFIKAKKVINRSLKRKYYYCTREWPYKNVKPRIIIEKYISNGKDLRDYKIHCFNGKPEIILVCQNRFTKVGLTEDFFDRNWQHLNIRRPNHPNCTENVPKPACLEEMLQLATVLSKNISFLRVDFYEIDGRVYFGELTFYPASGLERFEPESVDIEFGNMLRLDGVKKEGGKK